MISDKGWDTQSPRRCGFLNPSSSACETRELFAGGMWLFGLDVGLQVLAPEFARHESSGSATLPLAPQTASRNGHGTQLGPLASSPLTLGVRFMLLCGESERERERSM